MKQKKDNNQQGRCFLKSFHFKDFKGIKECSISNLPPNAQWIFLTGENGYGKTSILQAIAIGLFGEERHTFQYLDNIESKTQIIATHKFLGDKSAIRNLQRICCYGSSRLDMLSESSTKQKSPTLSLFETQNAVRKY